MIRYVKDKNNLVNHNIWSGTDYLKNTSGIVTSPTITKSSTTEWSSNSERSLKLEGSVESYAAASLEELTGLEIGAELTATVSVLNNHSSNAQLRFMELEGNEFNSVEIPSSSDVQEISISRTKSTDSATVQLLLVLRNPITVYVDNVRWGVQ